MYCLCVQYTFLMYRLESMLCLCLLNISGVAPAKYSVSVHSTHFWCTVWKMFFLFTEHMANVPSGKFSVSVHSKTFCCTVWRVFCFCAQITFLMYRLEIVLFLCTVNFSDVWDVPQLATSQKLLYTQLTPNSASVVPSEDGRLTTETCRGTRHNNWLR
jgi:predicted acyltransferase